MKSVHAIYENGVFRPTEPVELPEACHVVFEPKLIDPAQLDIERAAHGIDNVYALLSRRFDSGHADVAARHNEHQP
ncbi:MAG TPA: antitoxin AF2212-like protein [Pirellulales bacterium]|nr:antitoxin AF2212-like protein [Pirellulales bacterium]